MTLEGAAIALAGAGAAVTGALALLFLRDPMAALAQASHRAEKLPEVMTNRYIAMAVLALGATLYGDLKVIAALFGCYAFMGFADAWIYARGGHPFIMHLVAAVLALVVAGVALLTLGQGG